MNIPSIKLVSSFTFVYFRYFNAGAHQVCRGQHSGSVINRSNRGPETLNHRSPETLNP